MVLICEQIGTDASSTATINLRFLFIEPFLIWNTFESQFGLLTFIQGYFFLKQKRGR